MSWIEAHAALAVWVQGIGTSLAAFVALIAAWLAYRGAIKQIRSAAEARLSAETEKRRAIASALWAELNDSLIQIHKTVYDLERASRREARDLYISGIDMGLYDSLGWRISTLSSEIAYVTVQSYKIIKNMNDEIGIIHKIFGRAPDPMVEALRISAVFSTAIPIIETAMSKLAQLAEIDQTIADRAGVAFEKIKEFRRRQSEG